MPKKALVDFDLIKELSENISKKDKRFFRAKVKNSLNGSKRDKKIQKIRQLLMAATEGNKKSGKKRPRKSVKRSKPEKRQKTFTQFDSGSGSGSESGSSSGSSSESEPDGPGDTQKPNTEASGSSSCESESGEKNHN